MKKLLLIFGAVVIASSIFAQGTIAFNNRVVGTLVTRVYLGGYSQLAGNSAADTPSGSFDWAGFTAVSGAGYSAALLAAPGAGAAESELVFQPGSVTTFRTGAAAGQVAPLTVTLNGVAKDAAAATFQMVAWDNRDGTITTWDAALNAAFLDWRPLGKSPVFTVNAIGGDFNTPPYLIGLQSFNMSFIPEPSSFTLLGLGAAALMILRRRK